ncbi:hypothetical protein IU486_28370 [Streptomyces gardneri]|uniref:hypothetical protein n=1 Tax=Nocardia sputi TaxID=2943705 RepID=UPI0018952E78|nr:hypothetical protein [Nocardia sputi]MBF6168632.1 hypothetical protein [Streptomyces gardneri]MBF6208794.1 hypothetical protein [Streptomyces gardneri]
MVADPATVIERKIGAPGMSRSSRRTPHAWTREDHPQPVTVTATELDDGHTARDLPSDC